MNYFGGMARESVLESESKNVGDAKCETFQFKPEGCRPRSVCHEKLTKACVKPTEKHAYKVIISKNKHTSPSVVGQFRTRKNVLLHLPIFCICFCI